MLFTTKVFNVHYEERLSDYNNISYLFWYLDIRKNWKRKSEKSEV